jgi:hypothetical protein
LVIQSCRRDASGLLVSTSDVATGRADPYRAGAPSRCVIGASTRGDAWLQHKRHIEHRAVPTNALHFVALLP